MEILSLRWRVLSMKCFRPRVGHLNKGDDDRYCSLTNSKKLDIAVGQCLRISVIAKSAYFRLWSICRIFQYPRFWHLFQEVKGQGGKVSLVGASGAGYSQYFLL